MVARGDLTAVVVGSSPTSGSNAGVAQMEERATCNHEAEGSTPSTCSSRTNAGIAQW